MLVNVPVGTVSPNTGRKHGVVGRKQPGGAESRVVTVQSRYGQTEEAEQRHAGITVVYSKFIIRL